jgi:hypothetical protein
MNYSWSLLTTLGLLACSTSIPISDSTSPNHTQELQDLKIKLVSAAPNCKYSDSFTGPSKNTCVSEGTGTGDGDMMLFGGLLCLSGETVGCELVKNSFDQNGQPWRSPGRIGLNETDGFSRDMFLGVMAYLIKTQDTKLAIKFETWLSSNSNMLCLTDSDGRCEMRSTTWGLMGQVWKFLQLDLSQTMIDNQGLDDLGLGISVNFNEHGYQQHLTAVTILIRQKLGTYNTILKGAMETLVRKNPENPFFKYILEGSTASIQQETLTLCKLPSIEESQWLFEKLPEHQNYGMKWDCVFLINLLKGDH